MSCAMLERCPIHDPNDSPPPPPPTSASTLPPLPKNATSSTQSLHTHPTPVLLVLLKTLAIPVCRGLAFDPVAGFHLRNGAECWRLNWRADVSVAGLARSHGIMVNYMYDLDRVDENNRAYVASGTIAASPQVMQVLDEV
jgi:Malonyl-CoA decarboxylase C-terminal domain